MSSLAKTTIAAGLSWSGAAELVGGGARSGPLILGYHRVVESLADASGRTLPGMAVSVRALRAQLEWVGRRFRIVSLDELGVMLERHEACGRVAAVTFDDGYRDVHDHAVPLLRELGMPAAVFVVSSLASTTRPPLHDQLYQVVSDALAGRRPMPVTFAEALKARAHGRSREPVQPLRIVRELLDVPIAELSRMVDELRAQDSWTLPPQELATLDWARLAAMHRAGIIIGSHTHTHALLDHESAATVREELSRSRRLLEAVVGAPVRHFAYPDGRFNSSVVRAVDAAGYEFAYTICGHRSNWNPLLTIPRVMLWEGSSTNAFDRFSPSLMRCHAASILPFPARCREDHGLRPWWQAC